MNMELRIYSLERLMWKIYEIANKSVWRSRNVIPLRKKVQVRHQEYCK